MTRLPLLALLVACGPSPTATSTTPDEATGEPIEEGETAPAEDPPGEQTPRATDDPAPAAEGPPILAAHNRFRARHCAPPLTWSKELVAESRRWARNLAAHHCAFDHNPDPRYGENLAYFRPPGSLGEAEVAAHWYKEIERYNFKRPGFSMEAGHFTQLVWVGTRHLGCSSVECGGGELWVCNYDPPGNMEGDFDANVRREGCK
jgi:pathogenesis-related protein 1